MLPPTTHPDPSMAATTWTYARGSCSVIERGVRIRPERSHRRAVQKLSWRSSRWKPSDSFTVSDVGPTVALRRLLQYYENREFKEGALLISRLNHATFRSVLAQLPMDLLIDALPASVQILEALYSKVFLSDGLGHSVRLLRPDAAVWQLVHFFARHEESTKIYGSFHASCKKLLRVVALSEPCLRRSLQNRRRGLAKALAGLGQHGLVGTSDQSLMNLHDALRLELEKLTSQYKSALCKLEELSLAARTPVTRSVSYGPAPTTASHQRQLSLRQVEIQERLIKNKTLLNAVEPSLSNRSLDVLLDILRHRIEFDKDVLLQFTQVKREAGDVPQNAIVAPVLMRFSQGCEHVLSLMRNDNADAVDQEKDDNSETDISGYHSDSDSTVIMSQRARFNFLYNSTIRSQSRGGRSFGSSTDSHEDPTHLRTKLHLQKSDITHLTPNGGGTLKKGEDHGHSPDVDNQLASLRHEIQGLRCEVLKGKQALQVAREREKKMKDRLAEQAQRMLERGNKFENVNLGEKRPTSLIRCYGNLYTQARVDTLDALDSLPELRDAEELKAKLLFSVVVLAFRSVQSTLREIRDTVRRVLQIGAKIPTIDPAVKELEANIDLYLRRTCDQYDVKKNIEDVCSQIWATLYDYPSLKVCQGLVQYIQNCVKLAWALNNQSPAFVVEYETRLFTNDMHVRFHISDHESKHIKTYLWPALLEGDNGPCVHKGVVVT